MMKQLKTAYQTNSLSIGASSFDAAKAPLVFPGLQWGWQWLLPRIVSTLWPMSLLLVARAVLPPLRSRARALHAERKVASQLARPPELHLQADRATLRAPRASRRLRFPAVPLLVRTSMTDALTTIAAVPAGRHRHRRLLPGIDGHRREVALRRRTALRLRRLRHRPGRHRLPRETRRHHCARSTPLPACARNSWPGNSRPRVLVASAFLAIPIARAITLRPSSALPLLVSVLFLCAASTALGIVSSNPKTFIVGLPHVLVHRPERQRRQPGPGLRRLVRQDHAHGDACLRGNCAGVPDARAALPRLGTAAEVVNGTPASSPADVAGVPRRHSLATDTRRRRDAAESAGEAPAFRDKCVRFIDLAVRLPH